MLTPSSPATKWSDTRSYRIVLIASVIISVCAIVSSAIGIFIKHVHADLMAARITEYPAYFTILQRVAFIIKPLGYQMTGSYWAQLLGDRLMFLDYFPMLIVLLHVIGVVCFAVKKNAGVRLLRFAYSTWFIFRGFVLIEFLMYQAVLPIKLEYMTIPREPWPYLLLIVLVDVMWIGITAWLLSAMQGFMHIRLEGEGEAATFVPANRWRRFAHMQVDGWLMILIFLGFISTFLWIIREPRSQHINLRAMQFFLYLFMFVVQFLYYIIMESIWGLTPGKCLTGSVVRDDNGHKASVGKLMSRTLSRFIPFDNFSFFGWRGWHDRVSDTWVCREELVEDKT
ncbi:MAG: RDD family protein [Bacteroidetes bacterium]|nr:RDD family protein [Bacteroidota bacterium]